MALNDISLTASMRSNLISLQNTSTLLSRTQDRLSSGKKVNSALDNPTNFFAAQGHTQRASDLSTRKDGMTEAVQGVQAANKGISAITSLIESAKGLTQAARSADVTNRRLLVGQFNEIREQISQLATDSGYKGRNFLKDEDLVVLFNEAGGSNLTIAGFDASATGLAITRVQVYTAGSVGNVSGTSTAASTNVTTLGHIATLDATIQAANFVAAANRNGVSTTAVGASGASGVASGNNTFAIKFAGTGGLNIAGATGMNATGFTIQTVFIDGVESAAALAAAIITGSTGAWTVSFSGLTPATASGAGFHTGAIVNFNITVAAHTTGGAAASPNLRIFKLSGTDMAANVSGASGGAYVAISGDFKSSSGYKLSGQYIIFASGVVPPSGAGLVTYNAARAVTQTGFSLTGLSGFVAASGLTSGQTLTVQVGGVALTGGYTISGGSVYISGGVASGTDVALTLTTTVLAVSGGWDTDAGITASVSGLDTALNTLRSQSATLASNLSVVTIRQEFTDGMVNVLLKGADNLTLADMNEEGANMLMLQTRQQLGTTSLKMASDAAQSVLRLF